MAVTLIILMTWIGITTVAHRNAIITYFCQTVYKFWSTYQKTRPRMCAPDM